MNNDRLSAIAISGAIQKIGQRHIQVELNVDDGHNLDHQHHHHLLVPSWKFHGHIMNDGKLAESGGHVTLSGCLWCFA